MAFDKGWCVIVRTSTISNAKIRRNIYTDFKYFNLDHREITGYTVYIYVYNVLLILTTTKKWAYMYLY